MKRRKSQALLRTDFAHKTGSHRNAGNGFHAVPIKDRIVYETPVTVSKRTPSMPHHCGRPMRLVMAKGTIRNFWACRNCAATQNFTPLKTGDKSTAAAS